MKKRKLCFLFSLCAAAALLAFCHDARAWPVADTGQIQCYSDTAQISCPAPEEPLYGQDANCSINPPAYIRLDASGSALPDSAASWAMVRDNATGLVWEMKQAADGIKNYASPHDADNVYTWCDGSSGEPGAGTDTSDFIAALNAARFGGYSDWRLPEPAELLSIVQYAASGSAFDTAFFPEMTATIYWTSAPYAIRPDYAWVVNFYYGILTYMYKPYFCRARAVRSGGPASTSALVGNADGTVTDTGTGLMWQQATAPGVYTWEKALSYCDNLSLAGHSDWRLPTAKELQSIADYSRGNPAIDAAAFPDTAASGYWSSTTDPGSPNQAFMSDFYLGDVGFLDKSIAMYVRAVRGGECAAPGPSTTTTTVRSGCPCPSKRILGEGSPELENLRFLRDSRLSRNAVGLRLIEIYYSNADSINAVIDRSPALRAAARRALEVIAPMVGRREE